ncbi:MAG: RraA family protein [Rhodothermales bacterium]
MNPENANTKLAGLYTAVVADILDALGLKNQCLGSAIRATTTADRVAGRVFTMKAVAVHAEPAEPYKLEMQAIETAVSGDVLVVDAGNDRTCGFWGELLSTACVAKGIRGIVMNACTRDLWALRKMPFPVFGIGSAPADSKGRVDVVTIGEPIVIDGVTARNGDLVLGDPDGVVIVPQEVAPEVVERAWAKVSGENTVRDELAAGVSVAEVFRRHGIL